MKKGKLICLISVFSLMFACSEKQVVKIPIQKNKFIHIYVPAPDVYDGPSTKQLESGKYYKEWVANDHTFVVDKSENWHLFGITHPITSVDNVHEGEFQSFHSIQPEENFFDERGWIDLPKVLPPKERPGERNENHAPYVIEKEGLYYMVYGPSPIRIAISSDLQKWKLKGELFSEINGARDPSIIFHNGTYHIIYCTERKVNMRTSDDLFSWSLPKTIYESKTTDPESPTIIEYEGSFYLFVCGWNGIWDKKDIQGAYQHETFVYHSTDIDNFLDRESITSLNAHAPEIFRKSGRWYISSVEWPNRGVSVDELSWTDTVIEQ